MKSLVTGRVCVPKKLQKEASDYIYTLVASIIADHSGRAVEGMNCLRSLEIWDRGFESHSRHGCVFILCSCAILCAGSGLATG
jgi:hypothetical protein